MDDLRRRLARLGVTTGQHLKAKPAPLRRMDIDALVEGQVAQASNGTCFLVTRTFEPDWPHGTLRLSEWLELDPAVLAQLGEDAALARSAPHSLVFLDTETTGLGGGAFAFLVGVGFFNQGGAFEVRQYFLRDPAEEPAMLNLLEELIQPDTGLVTFNGRAFDVPLLAGRYVLARQRSRVGVVPNLDLLHPARRLWRRRLPSCALSSLEADVLGVRRTQADVPGALIPLLYRRYLETRDARDMLRVLYHNETDLLSMVTLGTLIGRTFTRPEVPDLPVEDRLSLARWYASRGLLQEAERAYLLAADQAPDAGSRYDALVGAAFLLKRAGRRAEALPLWEQLADLRLDTLGHVELAKHYEWHAVDWGQALEWTDTALRLAEGWRPGWRRTGALRELSHRRERLLRKLEGMPGEDVLPEDD